MVAPVDPHEVARRLEAVRQARETGRPKADAARALGMSESALNNWLRGYETGGKAKYDRPAITVATQPAPPRQTADPPKIHAFLRAGTTIEQLMQRTGLSAAQIMDEIDALKAAHMNIQRHGDLWQIVRDAPPPRSEGIVIETDEDNRLRFLAVGDKHVGSKYHRPDVLNHLYSMAADQGITVAFDTGNYIEGEASFNKHDLVAHGIDNQARLLAETHPRVDGLTTYAVTGDDHEGWYAQREGIDVGSYVEGIFRNAGRTDWVDLGYMESFVTLRNKNSGVETKILVMHPGGGSAYAVSYRPQKIVESFEGGEKPAVLLIGHYHKISHNLIRNVWATQTGCCQDQTPFMRKKGLDAHIGGVIMDIVQDPETGHILDCTVSFKRFTNRSATNNRWSHSGAVNLPERTLA